MNNDMEVAGVDEAYRRGLVIHRAMAAAIYRAMKALDPSCNPPAPDYSRGFVWRTSQAANVLDQRKKTRRWTDQGEPL